METAAQTGLIAVIVLEIERRHTGYKPGGRSSYIDGSLRTLEVIDIRCIVLCATSLTGNELGKFSCKGYLRWLGEVQEWYLVKHIGEPLTLLAPVEIDTPKGVLQRFGAHGYLGGKRLFGEVLDSTAQLEVLGKIILPVQSEHRFSRLSEIGITLQRNVDSRTGINDALVQDGHLAGTVIYRIVGALFQGDTACRNDHRALWHIVGIERDDIGCRALELSHNLILVLLGNLLGYGLRTVIKFGKGILFSLVGSHAPLDQIITHITAERLYLRNEHASVRDGIAFYIIEISIAVCLVVVIQTVGAQHTDDRLLLHLLLRDITEIYAGGIALVFHIQAELLLLYGRSQIINVLHHQPPVALSRIVAGILERFHEECLLGIAEIGCKLAHLIGNTSRCILIGYSKYLVGLQTGFQ